MTPLELLWDSLQPLMKRVSETEQNRISSAFHRVQVGNSRLLERYNLSIQSRHALHTLLTKTSEELIQRYQTLFEHSGTAVMVIEEDGTISLTNSRVEKIFGYRREEIENKKKFIDFLAPECKEQVSEYHMKRMENDPSVPDYYETKIRSKEGAVLDVAISVGKFPNTKQSVASIINITKRKQAEEALFEREVFLSNIFSSIQDGISILDKDLRIIRVNATMERWYAEAGPLFRKKCFEAYHGKSHQCDICPARTTLATGKAAWEIVPRRKFDQKNEGWLELHTFPLFDFRTEEMTGVIEYVRDITDRRIAEEALYQANQKLNLLSSITRHDILNLITALRGYQSLSEEIVEEGPVREFLEKEIQLTEAIQTQIEFTKDYQDLGVSYAEWHLVSVTLQKVQSSMNLAHVRLSMDLPDVEILADPLFEKVFYTLIENGIRHGERITSMHWSGHATDEGYVIVYEDDGAGVPDEDKDRIFIRGVGKHTGLGLFLSREICAITNISIRETGQYGKGARFEMLVPNGAYRFRDKPAM